MADHRLDPKLEWEAPAATTLRIAVCGCPDVHIILLDADGNGIARLTLAPETFEHAVSQSLAHIAAIRADQGDTIGNVAGTA